jgi:aspartate carbamoyltransferase regulatory subunit
MEMEEKPKKEIKITPIKNGTVIDHIKAGQAPIVLKILGIEAGTDLVLSLVMNVRSQKFGKKDIVMIEDRELNFQEVNKVTLIAPNATINIIRNCRVVKKEKVSLPEIIEAILKCPNPNCISNAENEPIKSRFVLEEIIHQG